MKVFISWSGNRSKAVAELLRVWIRCVLQATRPWLSARDIDRGAVWFTELADQLQDTSVAIVCLTHENKDRPWILFEAGAVMKGLSANRICTLLVDLEPQDIREPLYHFNHTLPNKQNMRLLVDTLNKGLGLQSLDDRILDQVFSTYWEMFETGFQQAIEQNQPTAPPKPREPADVLSEILNTTRNTAYRLAQIELKQALTSEFDKTILKIEKRKQLYEQRVGEAVVLHGEITITVPKDSLTDYKVGTIVNDIRGFRSIRFIQSEPGLTDVVISSTEDISAAEMLQVFLKHGLTPTSARAT
jgi:hypothetical protein